MNPKPWKSGSIFWAVAALALAGPLSAFAAGDRYEPDDKSPYAKTISNGQIQTRSIHVRGNWDWAKFTVTGAGARNVKVETAGVERDTQLWIYRSNSAGTGAGFQMAYDDDSGVGNFSRITLATLARGTYYIKVQEYGNNGTIPAYTLKASWTPR